MTCSLCDLPYRHALLVLDEDYPPLQHLVCRSCVGWLSERGQWSSAVVCRLEGCLAAHGRAPDPRGQQIAANRRTVRSPPRSDAPASPRGRVQEPVAASADPRRCSSGRATMGPSPSVWCELRRSESCPNVACTKSGLPRTSPAMGRGIVSR